jgi:MraZ protein
MSETVTSEPTYYLSTFRHGVDGKRRVQVPAKWCPEPPAALTLIPWPNGAQAEASLLVLPPDRMLALAEKIRGMSFADPEAQALMRLIGSKSASVTVDRAGRICIPEAMAKGAGIDKEALFVGLVDRFQIWNPERYEAVGAADAALTPAAFKLV